MTNDELADLLMKWPQGTEVSVLVDVNMSVDIERVSDDQALSSSGKLVPIIVIELPTPDISTLPPLRKGKHER